MPVKPDLWAIKGFPGLHSSLSLHINNSDFIYLSKGTQIFGDRRKKNNVISVLEAKDTSKLGKEKL